MHIFLMSGYKDNICLEGSSRDHLWLRACCPGLSQGLLSRLPGCDLVLGKKHDSVSGAEAPVMDAILRHAFDGLLRAKGQPQVELATGLAALQPPLPPLPSSSLLHLPPPLPAPPLTGAPSTSRVPKKTLPKPPCPSSEPSQYHSCKASCAFPGPLVQGRGCWTAGKGEEEQEIEGLVKMLHSGSCHYRNAP